jgi:hypothetical protein
MAPETRAHAEPKPTSPGCQGACLSFCFCASDRRGRPSRLHSPPRLPIPPQLPRPARLPARGLGRAMPKPARGTSA